MKLLNLLVLLIIALSGCTTVSSVHRPEEYYRNPPVQSTTEATPLAEVDKGMTQQEIEKVLSYRLALPKKNRVAILSLSEDSYWRYYSSDFVHLNDDTVKALIEKLRESKRVYDASFLPSMLIPEKKTIEHLRLAAARYQADVLLTYRSHCEDYQKFRVFGPDKTRSYCTVEAVAMDIRSGIVPFTTVSTNDFEAVENDKDINFSETRRKVELQAIAKGLAEVATAVRAYIEGMQEL